MKKVEIFIKCKQGFNKLEFTICHFSRQLQANLGGLKSDIEGCKNQIQREVLLITMTIHLKS
jgi:hypothetical protein